MFPKNIPLCAQSLLITSNGLARFHHRAHICSTMSQQIYMLKWQPSTLCIFFCSARVCFLFTIFFFFLNHIQHKFPLSCSSLSGAVRHLKSNLVLLFHVSEMNVAKVCGRENYKQIRNLDKAGIWGFKEQGCFPQPHTLTWGFWSAKQTRLNKFNIIFYHLSIYRWKSHAELNFL